MTATDAAWTQHSTRQEALKLHKTPKSSHTWTLQGGRQVAEPGHRPCAEGDEPISVRFDRVHGDNRAAPVEVKAGPEERRDKLQHAEQDNVFAEQLVGHGVHGHQQRHERGLAEQRSDAVVQPEPRQHQHQRAHERDEGEDGEDDEPHVEHEKGRVGYHHDDGRVEVDPDDGVLQEWRLKRWQWQIKSNVGFSKKKKEQCRRGRLGTG